MAGESRAGTASILALILLACLGLRVWYASEALRIDRFMDERYSLENVRSIVTTGALEPVNHYYPYPFFNLPPAILLAGSERLSEWTGNPSFETMTQGGYGAAAFLLIRLLQVAYGCLGVLLVFLVGREVFTREVGLLGALAVAWMPWHIHASGYFKPDVQLATMSMLAFYASLRAVERPAVRTYFLASVAVAVREPRPDGVEVDAELVTTLRRYLP